MQFFIFAVVYASLREHSAADVHSSKKHGKDLRRSWVSHKHSSTTKHSHKAWTMVGGCKKEPGAGMDASLGGIKVYKDGYFHLRCMMDKMETAADWHDELQREHLYNVHTNVSIVRYTDRVDVEKQQKMTPSVCFEFCRTVPDMLHFGLTAGRECYCTPYFMQGPGDGVCDAGCEGDSSITCGNTNGMADMYEMHSCNDAIGDAEEAFKAAVDVYNDAFDAYDYSVEVLDGTKAATDDIDDKELREGMMEFSTFINKESMTLYDTIMECESLMDDLDGKVDAAPADTLDYEVIQPIEEAKNAMMTCVKAMKEGTKSTTDVIESPEFAATLAVADLDLDAVVALA
jgi:transcription elongation factor Elf1